MAAQLFPWRIAKKVEPRASDGSAGTRRFGGRFATMLLSLSGFFLVGLVWAVLTEAKVFESYIVPSPEEVGAAFRSDWQQLLEATKYTGTVIIVGSLFSIVIAVPLALAITFSRVLSAIIYPLIIASHSVPKVALAPLILIWLGFGFTSGVVITVLIAFFPLVINSILGLKSLPEELLELARSMGANWLRTFLKIRVPYALPSFFSGLKVAVTLAAVGAVVAEFVAGQEGLGYYLIIKSAQVEVGAVFADLIVLSTLAIGIFGAVAVLEALVIPGPRKRRQT